MREKQYHFWPNGDAFDAWDVDRLVPLGQGLPLEEVSLDEISELDDVYWFHDEHRATVRNVLAHTRLILDADTSYPILLGPDGRVIDGMHRIARALLSGAPTLTAARLPVMPPPDYTGCTLGSVPDA